jgi:hypothetical protein
LIGVRGRELVYAVLFSASALAGPSRGQELELFEFDDYIDPRHLRTSLSGKPTEERGFIGFLAYAGYESNYMTRREAIEANVAFLHVAGNAYWGNCQANGSVERIWHYRQATIDSLFLRLSVPKYNTRVQVARYFSGFGSRPTRFLLSWNTVIRKSTPVAHEASLEIDFPVPMYRSVFGGVAMVMSRDEIYVGAAYQMPVWRWTNGTNVRLRLGGGNRWVCGKTGLMSVRDEAKDIFVRLDPAFVDDATWGAFKDMMENSSVDLTHRVARFEVILELRSFAQRGAVNLIGSVSWVQQSGWLVATSESSRQSFRIDDRFRSYGLGVYLDIPIYGMLL